MTPVNQTSQSFDSASALYKWHLEHGNSKGLYQHYAALTSDPMASPDAPLTPLTGSCAFCGQPLAHIFAGEENMATCLYCDCFQTIFTLKDENRIHWHPGNAPGNFFQNNPAYMKNDEEITARFLYGLKPSTEQRKAIWTANEFAEVGHAQIGGMPTAINDINYPVCPGCNKTMPFTAQFDQYNVDGGEGIYYFFTCKECKVCGSNYGQS